MFLFGSTTLPNRCWKRNLSFRLFLIESSRFFRSSMMGTYLQNRIKSKRDRNCLTSCHSARSLPFKNVINDLLINFIIHKCTFYVWCLMGWWLFYSKLNELRERLLTNGKALKNALHEIALLIFPRVLTSLLRIFNCWLLYRLRKYLKCWLVVQNLKIAIFGG